MASMGDADSKGGDAQAPRRFGILQCGVTLKALMGEFSDKDQMIRDWLQNPKEPEVWDTFRCFKGEFPPLDSLSKYSGFVISGSKFNAHDNNDWILQLRALLAEVYRRRIRCLGLCFGHQISAIALGGDSNLAGGWELGVKEIQLLPAFGERYPQYSALQSQSHFMLEVHRDQVKRLPPGALLLASSAHCPIEMYQAPAQDPIFMCTQFHPEYTVPYVTALVEWGSFPWDDCTEALSALDAHREDGNSPPLRAFLKRFIKEGFAVTGDVTGSDRN
jgi:GMP synthase-like glutamine amidotransferase